MDATTTIMTKTQIIIKTTIAAIFKPRARRL